MSNYSIQLEGTSNRATAIEIAIESQRGMPDWIWHACVISYKLTGEKENTSSSRTVIHFVHSFCMPMLSLLGSSPTGSFAIWELQRPSIDTFYVVQTRCVTDFRAPKIWKGRPCLVVPWRKLYARARNAFLESSPTFSFLFIPRAIVTAKSNLDRKSFKRTFIQSSNYYT